MTKIYHNQRCTKSRQTLEILKEKNLAFDIVDYQQNPPSKEELKDILKLLGMKPFELIRRGEPLFKEKFKGEDYTDDEWIDIMISHPKLIERPIVVSDGKAVIGRPPENVNSIL